LLSVLISESRFERFFEQRFPKHHLRNRMMRLPWELVDKILVDLNDPVVVIELERFCILSKITGTKINSHQALETGKSKYLQFLGREMIKELRYSTQSMQAAASRGHLNVLQLLERVMSGCLRDKSLIDYAALGGHWKLVKWLHFVGANCTPLALNWAASKGYLDIVVFLHKNRTEGCTKMAIDKACGNGHLKIVQFLHENRKEGCSNDAVDKAAKNGHLQVVKYLIEDMGKIGTPAAMDNACANGHTAVVKYLHDSGSSCTEMAMNSACENGHLKIVEFLCDNRTEGCTKEAMDGAAENGHLEVIKFLATKKSLRFDNDTIESAIANGHLEVVKYLVGGRKMTKQAKTELIEAAERHKQARIVYWLSKN
jgi:Ankyrin repeats (3 copies)